MLAEVSFDGFDRAVLRYLSELRANNDREGSRLIARSRGDLLLDRARDFGWVELSPVPEDVFTSRFPRFCAERYRPLAPLLDWLRPVA